MEDNRVARDAYCISIQQTKETGVDSATVSPSAQSRCLDGPVRNKSRCVSPTCPKIPVRIIHRCSLYAFIRLRSRARSGPISWLHALSPTCHAFVHVLDGSRSRSVRSIGSTLREVTRGSSRARWLHPDISHLTLAHRLGTPPGRCRRIPTQLANHSAEEIEVVLKT